MGAFRDAAGDVWRVELIGETIKRAWFQRGLDLGRPWDPAPGDERPLVVRLDRDPDFAGDLVWLVCESQAAARSVERLAFAGRLDGAALKRAVDALVAAWVDFFPLPRDEDQPEKPDDEAPPPDTWTIMLQYAAVAQTPPEPRTLRELVIMAEAADRFRWNRTFAAIAAQNNLHVKDRADAVDPNKFFPWDAAAAEPVLREPTPEQEAQLETHFPG